MSQTSTPQTYRGVRIGVALAEAPKDLTGLQILQLMVEGKLPAPGITQSLRFWFAEVAEGRAVFEGEPGEESLNPMGGVHGGWPLTLIDSACGCAGMSVLPVGAGYTTLETKANMTRAIKPNSGVYRCAAKVLATGRQIITTDATLTGPEGKLYAHGTSTLLVLRER